MFPSLTPLRSSLPTQTYVFFPFLKKQNLKLQKWKWKHPQRINQKSQNKQKIPHTRKIKPTKQKPKTWSSFYVGLGMGMGLHPAVYCSQCTQWHSTVETGFPFPSRCQLQIVSG